MTAPAQRALALPVRAEAPLVWRAQRPGLHIQPRSRHRDLGLHRQNPRPLLALARLAPWPVRPLRATLRPVLVPLRLARALARLPFVLAPRLLLGPVALPRAPAVPLHAS